MGNFQLQAAILVSALTTALGFWEEGRDFFLVLEDHEANWSDSLQLFLAGLRKGREASLGIGKEALGCCREVKRQLLSDPASEKDGTETTSSQDSVVLTTCSLWEAALLNWAVLSFHVSMVNYYFFFLNTFKEFKGIILSAHKALAPHSQRIPKWRGPFQ